jgi:predicted protein tyrosine phosphatase
MKTVAFYSQRAVERIGQPSNIISIGEAGDYPAFKVNHKRLLRLEFDDILAPIADYRPFMPTHAKEILAFLETCGVEPVLVHCHASISLSAAVARFMEERLGYTIVYTPLSSKSTEQYNRRVYEILTLIHMDLIRA